MEDVKAFRIISYASEPPIHMMSVISNGDMAMVVYPDRVESSTNPASRIAQHASMMGTPNTAVGWANLEGMGGSYYGVSLAPTAPGATVQTLIAQEEDAIGQEDLVGTGISEGTLPFNDSVDSMTAADPELDALFSTGEAAEEPAGMREYVKQLLVSNNALHLNPGLKDWLAGGPPPTDETFDGIVWSA